MNIKIERTGNIFSISSTEYLITYPDNSTEILWSPPWHDWNDEEDARALLEASNRWLKTIQEKINVSIEQT